MAVADETSWPICCGIRVYREINKLEMVVFKVQCDTLNLSSLRIRLVCPRTRSDFPYFHNSFVWCSYTVMDKSKWTAEKK